MTLDIELVRKILLAIAATEQPLDSAMVRIANYGPEQIREHIHILHKARLLDGDTTLGPDRRLRWHELRLTWRGHDFVDCARSEVIWRLASEALDPDRSPASLEMWHKMLVEATYSLLGRSSNA